MAHSRRGQERRAQYSTQEDFTKAAAAAYGGGR